MSSRLSSIIRLRSHFLHRIPATTTTTTATALFHNSTKSKPIILTSLSDLHSLSTLRFFSTSRRHSPTRPKPVDIGARARQLQNRRLWTYALTFSCIAGFIVIVLNNFQDQLVFYVTPSDAVEKFNNNPSKNKFRLGGLVLEDILVKYEGSLPDLFREGHSVVVEGFMKELDDKVRKEVGLKNVSGKARSGECYFKAFEVLAKHDEKYMPQEVAAAIERNKKLIEAGEVGEGGAEKKK
ncbi:cytochrome c-type biogenesis protein CcmE [Populus alba x Populus x berolinensis]|uniref:Cytochrome c-type biogenesis protein CcmE n=1 Tax=Populus alba x Populus x berolinensis TaxID=444605 RepID=A0AAD6RA18_9ROSI|nr:cytochrome c-type biogenesis protein CcmE [Populus alba x Populus x berolinensis]